jgi:hypothetical protein
VETAQAVAGSARTEERNMTAREEIGARSAELQQQWHGWGSPVGLGIAMLSTGAFAVLLAEAWRLVS